MSAATAVVVRSERLLGEGLLFNGCPLRSNTMASLYWSAEVACIPTKVPQKTMYATRMHMKKIECRQEASCVWCLRIIDPHQLMPFLPPVVAESQTC